MSVAGSIIEVSIDGRAFGVAADADVNRKLGGYENEVQANGNRTGRQIKTAVVGMYSGIVIDIDDDRGDQEFIQQRADSNAFVACVVTHASGVSYEGDAQVSGELNYSNQSGTMSVDLSAPGGWTQQ